MRDLLLLQAPGQLQVEETDVAGATLLAAEEVGPCNSPDRCAASAPLRAAP